MSLIQQMEEADYSASARFDRFDGFDRGDTDYDYEAEQQARNEADEQAFTAWAADLNLIKIQRAVRKATEAAERADRLFNMIVGD